MTFRRKAINALAFAAACAVPAGASAQTKCITEQQVGAMVVYAVPLAMDALQTRCSATLSPDGFLAVGAPAMAERYAEQSEAVWPTAFSAFLVFAGDNASGMSALQEMPEDTLRPFLDALVSGMISNEIPTEKCRDIERLLAALDPLEPEEAGRLVAVIAALAEVDDPEVCPA